MIKLKNTKIYRGGLKSRHKKCETKKCLFQASVYNGSLNLSFDLKSKGGGTTAVVIHIGLEALPQILNAIARTFPELGGVLLLEYAALANDQNLAKSIKAEKKVEAQAKRGALEARRITKQLKFVEKFVSEKYHEIPHGHDGRELAVLETLGRVMRSLE